MTPMFPIPVITVFITVQALIRPRSDWWKALGRGLPGTWNALCNLLPRKGPLTGDGVACPGHSDRVLMKYIHQDPVQPG